MKIKSLKIEYDDILGDLFLDFSLNNKASDTVILAGENGTGKTIILEILFIFYHFNLPKYQPLNGKREFVIEFNNEEIKKLKEINKNVIKNFFNNIKNNEISIKIDYSVENWDGIIISPTRADTIMKYLEGSYCAKVFSILKKITKVIYLDTEINFNPGSITSVTAMDLDQSLDISYKTDTGLAKKITQLLVDIQASDDSEIAEQYRINRFIDEDKTDLRIKRFKNAFDYMFPYKKYKGVINEDGLKKVIFEEFSKEMPIDNLSSGEKQIVFRGSFLLQNKKIIKDCLILIDEPEISLHPRWQLKIVEFYKYLFKDVNNKQNSQLFFATHSPFIIDNIDRYEDKIVILNKDKTGRINLAEETKYFGWSNEKIIDNAFHINLHSGNQKPTVFVEGETDEMYIKKSIDIFDNFIDDINILQIGYYDKNGNLTNSGCTGLNRAKQIYSHQHELPLEKIILLYDFDRKMSDDVINNKLFIISTSQNKTNKIFKKGIENLLNIPKDFKRDNFYRTKTIITDYGENIVREELDKGELCKWICDKLKKEEQIKYLSNFKGLVGKLKTILF